MNRTKLDRYHLLSVGTKENGSNYNKYAKIFRGDELLFGTIFKGTEPLSNIVEWAKQKIESRNETLDRIFKEMDELGL